MSSIFEQIATVGLGVYKELDKMKEQEATKKVSTYFEMEESKLQEKKMEIEMAEQEKELRAKYEAREEKLLRRIAELEQKVYDLTHVKYHYSMEKLNGMKTTELKQEVYAVYRDNASVFDEKYEIGKEAKTLYFKDVYSESRYRAELIKFLFEKGNL